MIQRLKDAYRPENDIQRLATWGAGIGLLAALAATVSQDASLTGGGVGLGLWLAATYLWVTEPGSFLA